MKTFFTVATLLGVVAVSQAQIKENPDGSITCPASGGNFCASPSLTSNIIIRCQGTTGQPGNCNDNLAGVPPAGVKTDAFCWQSSPTAGDASCSINGLVYGPNGTFPVGGKNTTSSSSTTSSTSTPPFTNSSSTTTSSSTTVVTLCPSCTTSLPGGTVVSGGGSSPSTITTVVPGSTGGSGSGAAPTTSPAGSTPTPGLQGNEASSFSGRSGVWFLTSVLAGLLAWGMI